VVHHRDNYHVLLDPQADLDHAIRSENRIGVYHTVARRLTRGQRPNSTTERGVIDQLLIDQFR